MELLKAVFETTRSGDRILVTLPDLYSFLTISRSIANYNEPFWILWTDAAVERINHLGRKYGFPVSGDALIVESRKDCIFLNGEKVELKDLPKTIKNLTYSVVISFGLNFLSLYNYSLNKAIEAIIEHESGLMFNCVINMENLTKLIPFHDVYLEVLQAENPAISYHTYTANLKFNMKGGIATLSDTFSVYES
ncbi:hypothetical protein DRO97_10070 [Archaeoglobales archaeon]|nr:MAG: hypothetical protein DRO97_10070 [Archaeoglobales archaeon]